MVERGGLQNRYINAWVQIPSSSQTIHNSRYTEAHWAVGHQQKQIRLDKKYWVCYRTTRSDTPKYSSVAQFGLRAFDC